MRRRTGRTGLGPLPLANVVLVELALAVGVVLLAVGRGTWPVAAVVVVAGAALALGRRHGRWSTEWLLVVLRHRTRTRRRAVTPTLATADAVAPERTGTDGLVGVEDARVGLLRLLVEDLVVASRTDHENHAIGLAWHDGTWTAAVAVDPVPDVVAPVGARTDLPLAGLAACLQDRGVVLDGIQVLWHCYPGSSTLPAGSPALAAYHELLGPLSAVARRSTWVMVRLDPRRCPEAVRERGGGVPGAHRALLGAVSRVCGVLDAAGLDSRVLDTDELLRAATSCAELGPAAGRDGEVELVESWRDVTAGGVVHASSALAGWGEGGLDALTGVRVLSTTVALAMSPGGDDGSVGLRGLVRLSARSAAELRTAQEHLAGCAEDAGIGLTPLHGEQAAALRATLPVGGAA